MLIYSEKVAETSPLFVYSLNPLDRMAMLTQIGNKARNLINLYQLGYKIPASVFIDYTFYKDYIKNKEVIKALVDIIGADLPSGRLAVRSSTSIEDSKSESFAGLFKTILNIDNNPPDLSETIIECFQLYSSPEFSELIKTKNQFSEQINIGLIIQRMIAPQISGVLFTCSPLNPTNNCYQIEYCAGTGDKLTRGSLTGNLLNLDKSYGRIVQQRGTIFLSRSHVQSLFEIAKTLEAKFTFPQDIEFVISDDDELFLLQARPITALSFAPEFVTQRENIQIEQIFSAHYKSYSEYPVFSDTNIAELFPTAVPLGFSIFKTIFAGTLDRDGGINLGRTWLGYAPIEANECENLFINIGDQARVNLFIDALTFRLDGIDKKVYIDTAVKRYMDIVRLNPQRANYPEYSLYVQSEEEQDWIELFGNDGKKFHEFQALFLDKLKSVKIPETLENIPAFLNENEKFYRKELSTEPEYLDLTELQKKIRSYVEYLRSKFAPEYVIVARIGFLSAYLVKNKLNKFFKKTNSHYTKPNNVDEYFDLLLLAHDNCPSHFKMPNQSEHEKRVKASLSTVKEFLNIFQHLGPLDISQPRLGEYSKDFLSELLMHRGENSIKNVNGNFQSDLVDEFYRNYQRESSIDIQDFKRWTEIASLFMNLRETFKFELLKIIYLIKRLTKQLTALLNLHDAIYYLEIDELLSVNHESDTLRLRAMQQKAYFEACTQLVVNKVISNARERNISKRSSHYADLEGEYKSVNGSTIHFGKAAGIALVARTNQEYYKKLKDYRVKGIVEIIGFFKGVELSCLSLTELRGIVTENGGYLAHAATIAREHNIPYISNVKVDYFKDGYYVILDTNNQQVVYKEQP